MSSTLVVFNKKGQRKNIPLGNGVAILGRRPDCDVRVPLLLVSRKHCRITLDDEKTIIQDLGSANGTFVNCERITEAVVKAGDIISIGSVHFTLQVNGEPAEIKPPESRSMKNDLDDSTQKRHSGISKTLPYDSDGAGIEFDPLADIMDDE